MKTNIKSFNIRELKETLLKKQFESFRATQVLSWLYGKSSMTQFSDMTNVNKQLRSYLDENFSLENISLSKILFSNENTTSQTVKCLFTLSDGKEIETVLIPHHREGKKNRLTVCVSSQVGCSLNCAFCATGKMGFTRNLTLGEILDQVTFAQRWTLEHFNQRVTNIVFMGMGEPMLNYETVTDAIQILTGKLFRFQIGETHITLSTAGLVKGIRELGASKMKTKLAISLHSAIQSKREQLMPIAKQHSLIELKQAILKYQQDSSLDVFYEYLLLDNMNDNDDDAKALIQFTKDHPCKINLIEYNPIGNGTTLKKSSNMQKFFDTLNQHPLTVTIRKSRGVDIRAACGQLISQSSRTNKKIT